MWKAAERYTRKLYDGRLSVRKTEDSGALDGSKINRSSSSGRRLELRNEEMLGDLNHHRRSDRAKNSGNTSSNLSFLLSSKHHHSRI